LPTYAALFAPAIAEKLAPVQFPENKLRFDAGRAMDNSIVTPAVGLLRP